MFVDEVIVRLSLLYDLVNVLAGVSPPVGANDIEDFSETQIIIWAER